MAGAPPAFVAVAGHDPLRDDGLRYARAPAGRRGRRGSVERYEDMVHGFLRMGGVFDRVTARAGMSAWLARAYARDGASSRTERPIRLSRSGLALRLVERGRDSSASCVREWRAGDLGGGAGCASRRPPAALARAAVLVPVPGVAPRPGPRRWPTRRSPPRSRRPRSRPRRPAPGPQTPPRLPEPPATLDVGRARQAEPRPARPRRAAARPGLRLDLL